MLKDFTSHLAIARSIFDDSLSSVDIPDYDFLRLLIVVIVMDNKGGIGKSLLAQIIATLLRLHGDNDVAVVDTDFGNSTSFQIERDVKMLDLARNGEGTLLTLLRGVRDGRFKSIVIDVGAREEQQMTALLPWLVTLLKKLDGRVVVARPVTLGSHNQNNAARFMDIAVQLSIPTIFVQNEGQGRDSEYFEDWRASATCQNALGKGAVHTELLDFGVRHADEAIGFGLSLSDAALQDFSKIEDAEEKAAAQAYFNDDICALINERLRMCMRNVGDAIEHAIVLRDRLDGRNYEGTPPADLPPEPGHKRRSKKD